MRSSALALALVLAAADVEAAELALPAPLTLADLGLEALVPGGLSELSGQLVIAFHDEPAHAIAYYLPAHEVEIAAVEASTGPRSGAPARAEGSAGSGVEARSVAALEGDAEVGAGGTARLTVPPRLMLFRSLYAPAGVLRPLLELPVDAVEYLVHALLEARFDLAQEAAVSAPLAEGAVPPSPTLQQQLEVRAMALFVDLPEAVRVEALVEAYADFGAHLVSLANEIERRRRDADPARFCAVARSGQGLFMLWSGAFERHAFPGSYYRAPADEPGELPGERVYSAHSLSTDDRRWMAREILEVGWTGDVGQDLVPRLCG